MLAEARMARGAEGPTQGPMLTEAEGGAGHEAEEELPASAPHTPMAAPASEEGAVALKGVRGR